MCPHTLSLLPNPTPPYRIFRYLIEDGGDDKERPSYVDYLCRVHRKIQTKPK